MFPSNTAQPKKLFLKLRIPLIRNQSYKERTFSIIMKEGIRQDLDYPSSDASKTEP